MKNLLLVSNSTLHGGGYLDHCEPQIKEILGERKSVLFVPYARPSGKTHDEYTELARARFAKMGYDLRGIHESVSWGQSRIEAVLSAEAIFIGGGNTFVLLRDMLHGPLMNSIYQRVVEGVPYIGTSAGSNVAGRTIMTTNDMPIANPREFRALGLVPFVINPHYQDALQLSDDRIAQVVKFAPELKTWLGHQGETRETRIKEYHVFNDDTVVGLREGAMLRVVGSRVTLQGTTGARIFRKGLEPTEHLPGEPLDFLFG